MKTAMPLWQRLYQDEVYTEVCRLIGYLGCQYRDLWQKLKPAIGKHGQQKVESATAHLLTYDKQFTVNPPPLAHVELRANVRRLCIQLLGPPPEMWDEFYANVINPPPNPYKQRPTGRVAEKPKPQEEVKPEPTKKNVNAKAKKPHPESQIAEAGISSEGFASLARDKNKRQLFCMLRNARQKLKHHGRKSFLGKEAKKEIAAAEAELKARKLAVPNEGQEMPAREEKKRSPIK